VNKGGDARDKFHRKRGMAAKKRPGHSGRKRKWESGLGRALKEKKEEGTK